MLSTNRPSAKPSRPALLHKNLSEHYRVARHVFLVAAPVGVVVGSAIAAYDYVVNVLLWERFTHSFTPELLCLLPFAGMFLTGLILSVFRVANSSMADEVVKEYHKPDSGIDYGSAAPKLAASIATMGFGASAGMEGASKWLGGTISSFIQRKVNGVAGLRWLHG
ncbi:MAG: chloride channel protein, partial [Acidobacteria bacterium]|nr:chloride channel protein [Acidobacteriota bacterium]